MKKRLRILTVVIVSTVIIIPTLYLRMNINDWFYTNVIKFIPRAVWVPMDTIFALVWYIILSIGIYWIWDERVEKNDDDDE